MFLPTIPTVCRFFTSCTDVVAMKDAGDKDEGGFYRGCSLLAKTLHSRGAQVENHLNKGHHNIQYIKDNLESYFRFYSIIKKDNEVLH